MPGPCAGRGARTLDAQDLRLGPGCGARRRRQRRRNRDQAAADFKRYQRLQRPEFISGAELERRETALKVAQAQLEQARRSRACKATRRLTPRWSRMPAA